MIRKTYGKGVDTEGRRDNDVGNSKRRRKLPREQEGRGDTRS